MFEVDVTTLNADATLSHVTALRAVAERADRSILAAAAHWADLHGVVDDIRVALPGTERLVGFGGEGTPEVAEFAPAELGAELRMSPFAAGLLMGDALDLRHRLPVLWGRICAGEVKPWVGRKVAQATRPLSEVAVGAVDAKVSRWADRLTWGRLSAVVDAAVLAADPAAGEAASDSAGNDCGVWVGQSNEHGTKTVFIRAEAPDVIWFDAAIDRIADGICLLGDGTAKDTRRARAVGILAHPQQALDLFDQAAAAAGTRDAQDSSADHAVTGKDDVVIAASASRRTRKVDSLPPATLYVHISRAALDHARNEVARVEGVGPVTVKQAQRWLGHCRVTVKPVIDLAGVAPVDGYEVPDRLREAVHLMSPADIFPFAGSTSRTRDIDHTTPYWLPPDNERACGSGPPDQTRIGKPGPHDPVPPSDQDA